MRHFHSTLKMLEPGTLKDEISRLASLARKDKVTLELTWGPTKRVYRMMACVHKNSFYRGRNRQKRHQVHAEGHLRGGDSQKCHQIHVKGRFCGCERPIEGKGGCWS